MFTHISRSIIFVSLTLAVIAALAIVRARHWQSSRDILTRPVSPADHRISYGQNEFQFGELRLPKGAGPHPVAIVIHGGCWMSEYGLSYMSNLSAALAEAGVATWSVEYRRVGRDTPDVASFNLEDVSNYLHRDLLLKAKAAEAIYTTK